MGDADLIVQESDKVKAGELLEKLGFKKTVETNEWVYIKGRFEVELHHALAYDRDQFQEAALLNDFWPYVTDNKLDISYHLIYLLFHLCRHLLFEGAGFRQFMDIAVVCKNAELDWNWLKDNLQKVGLYDFAVSVFGMNERWFGVKTSISGTVDEDFYNKVTEKIFKDGVFGHNNEDNRHAAGIVISMQNDSSTGMARIKYALSQVFPNYKEISRSERYSYIRKWKILLPIAWIQRGINRIANKTHRQNFINRTMTPSAEIEERAQMMKQWGL